MDIPFVVFLGTGILLMLLPYAVRTITAKPSPGLPGSQQTVDMPPVHTLLSTYSFGIPPAGNEKIEETGRFPKRILIPGVRIDLPVVEASLENGYWTLSESSASHGAGTANPGDAGNIVIFAHARPHMFASLRSVTKDMPIYVMTDDSWHTYTISQKQTVTPDTVDVLSKTDTETLTLFTCTGLFDTKRLIVKAVPAHKIIRNQ